MRIDGVSSAAMQPNTVGMGSGMGGQMDAVSKDLQNQINELQKKMQELSSNQEIPMETKMKKRQEMQKQISELEVQLRQHQVEARRQETQKKQKKQNKGNEMDEMLGSKTQGKQGNGQGTGMSAGSMEALLSADASMKQASVHGSTAKKMEGRANVLKSEIQLDGSRGGDTSAKEAELAETEKVADQATASQMQSLAQAGKTLQEASDDEKKENKTKKSDETSGKTDVAVTAEEGESDKKAGDIGDGGETGIFDVEMPGVPRSRGYQPVDVRL